MPHASRKFLLKRN